MKMWRNNIKSRKNWEKRRGKINFRSHPQIGKHEKEILDFIEPTFYPFKIQRQFPIIGYWLDGYCKERNISFEIDEKHHLKTIDKDKMRDNLIKQELGCSIIRIPLGVKNST